MKQDIFAIGDPHGCLSKLETLLKDWNPDKQQLVILGDLMDRGVDGYGVLRLAMKLQKEYGAVILGGNHEDLLLNFLDDPNEEASVYINQGGRENIRSFFKGEDVAMRYLPETVAKMMKEQFPDEISFIRGLPDYYESGCYVFVHAGVDLYISNWKNTRPFDFRWIRSRFHHAKNETGKIFVFGHTITPDLNPDRNCGIWMSPCKTKIGIDGGAVFGGLLLGLHITEDAYEVYAA